MKKFFHQVYTYLWLFDTYVYKKKIPVPAPTLVLNMAPCG